MRNLDRRIFAFLPTRPGDLRLDLVLTFLVACLYGMPNSTQAGDGLQGPSYDVTYLEGETEQASFVRMLAKTSNDYRMVLKRDGQIDIITPSQFVSEKPSDRNFEPYTIQEMQQALREEFDPRARIVTTEHYVIVSAANPEFTEWCSKMFERLYHTYYQYWDSEELPLHEPDFPLVAVILPDLPTFRRYSVKVLGKDPGEGVIGFYSPTTNRMVMSDLASRLKGGGAKAGAQLNQLLTASANSVSTVVHEATHQIAYNCGMHVRKADTPTWLAEGVALYCDSPDLRSGTGWKTIGKVRTFIEIGSMNIPSTR